MLRGIAIILMALDHVRIYFGYGTFFAIPVNAPNLPPFLFFTRWITQFCAPIFIFLSGISAYLFGIHRKNKKKLSFFLLTRGLFLVILELTIVNFGWTFDITLGFHILQVIWVIGLSMVFMSLIIFLPQKFIALIGLVLILGHNLLDQIHLTGNSLIDMIWYVLHQPKLVLLNNNSAIDFVYSLIPWLGLMAVGYVCGSLYVKYHNTSKRRRYFLCAGLGCILLFLILRVLNMYGDPNFWHPQQNFIQTLMAILNTTKYPASLQYILMTIGPSLIVLSCIDFVKNKISHFFSIFGRVPLFFYVIHLYLIHLLAILFMIALGRNWQEYIFTVSSFTTRSSAHTGFNLIIVYVVWVFVLALMYPLCLWYNTFKNKHKSSWWKSYA